MDEIEKLGLGGPTLVDVSSDNDALIDQPCTDNQNNKISFALEAVGAEKGENLVDIKEQVEQVPQSFQPLEAERTRKTGKCNLRKSLAWDTAFFTSAGVLDPDELSTMIEGDDKGGKHFLPIIEEDAYGSSESISTLQSELTLESLEADLFKDVRASIQKFSKASNIACSSKTASGGTKTQEIYSLKKVDVASKNTVKTKPVSKKQSIAIQGPGKVMEQSSGSSQGTQSVARNKGLTSTIPKAPKVTTKPNPSSSASLKRTTLCRNQVKIGNDNASLHVPGKVVPVPKILGLGGSSTTVPKAAPSSKSSFMSSSTATKRDPTRSSSSCDSSSSASSTTVGISAMKSNSRRIDSRISNPTSSSSSLKTPSKVAVKKKGQSGLSTSLVISKLHPNTSPASSICVLSSQSSSSNSSVIRRSSSSKASIDTTSPSRSLDRDASPALDHHNRSNDRITDNHGNKLNRLPSKNVKTASMQIGAPSRPPMAKPSGLRVPSPKIGFFDGAKQVARTPEGSRQSYSNIPAGPKVAAGFSSPSGGSGKAKHAKLQPTRTVPAIGGMKLDGQKPASSVSSKRSSNASSVSSGVVALGIEKCLSISPQVQNETDGERSLKVEKVGLDRANNVPDPSLGPGKTGSPGVLKSETNLEKLGSANSEDGKIITLVEGDTCASGSLKMHSAVKSNEKENAYVGDQVDELSLHVGAMDLKHELQKELVGNSVSEIGFSCTDSGAPELCSKEFFVVPGQKEEGSVSNNNTPGPCPIRTPFAVRNAVCNTEGIFPSSD